jgi:hypothetical protein
MPTVAEAKHRLKGIEGHVAVAIWQREDVIGRAEERGIKITDEQADDILDNIDRKQDCEYGISWTTIDCYLDDFKTRG